ncbi:MAG: branched-chain amino acid ABC transporter permease [Deltaproteobacteria bacterium]
MESFLLPFISGLGTGMVLFLIASGLSLIWGTSRVFNIAHASLYMLGAYFMYAITHISSDGGELFFWIALISGPIFVAILGGIIEITLLRKLYSAEQVYVILFFIGLIYIIDDLVKLIWGSLFLSVPMPTLFSGSMTIMGQDYPSYFILILGLSTLITGGLWFIIYRTRFGLSLRAAVMDREMLGALGINTSRLFTLTFILGCWLAGVAGCLIAPIRVVEPTMDGSVIVEAIAVVIIGGLGSIPGTLVASLIIGELGAFGILAFPYLSTILVFLVMAVVITVRPWGLMGVQE